MITAIEKIHGIGRYGCYDGPVAIHKNQVVFGFNGAGKSTLSDIFYSLKNDEDHLALLPERRTLTTDAGETPQDQVVELATEAEPLIFNGTRWNRDVNIHVFNDQYIDEYLFIGENYADGGRPIGLGAQETQKLNVKQQYEAEFRECLDTVNQTLINNKEVCRKAKLGQIRIPAEKWHKRINAFAELAKIHAAKREEIRKNHEESKPSDPNLRNILAWQEQLSRLYSLFDSSGEKVMQGLPQLLKDTPEITGRELAAHMQLTMKKADPAWLAQGRRYQRRENLCPYCGQEIRNPDFSKLARDLDRFISGRQREKETQIRETAEKARSFLDEMQLDILQQVLEDIHDANEGIPFLTKRTLNLVNSLCFPGDVCIVDVTTLLKKLDSKRQNPYDRITLNPEETELCGVMARILEKLGTLREKLGQEQERCADHLRSQQEYEFQDGLYEIFFGDNRDIFQEAIACAVRMLELYEKIRQLQKELGEMLDVYKLEKVNRFLEEVNVNFTVEIVDNAYRVKIRGYESSKYQKGNKLLCSEGERRMLAFAYFLQEVAEDQENKIVVVDDPVSSMDSSRRSVVAYKLMTLMQEQENQVIVLSHDLFFVERLDAVCEKLKTGSLELLQINKNGQTFSALDLNEYLVSDREVYERMIRDGMASDALQDKMIAWIAMRPFVSVVTEGDDAYRSIEARASYLAHSRYSESKNVKYHSEDYSKEAMTAYCEAVNRVTGKEFNADRLLPEALFGEDGVFSGFDYKRTWELYESISLDSMTDLRKKALVFRLVLETSLYMLKESDKKLNLERIGSEYNKLKKSAEITTRNPELKEKRRLSLVLCKLYEFSKKYHHGADEGSTLGLSSLNPEEMYQYDREIQEIHNWITAHPKVTA